MFVLVFQTEQSYHVLLHRQKVWNFPSETGQVQPNGPVGQRTPKVVVLLLQVPDMLCYRRIT